MSKNDLNDASRRFVVGYLDNPSEPVTSLDVQFAYRSGARWALGHVRRILNREALEQRPAPLQKVREFINEQLGTT